MTVSAFLSVAPVVEGSMAQQVAEAVDALDGHDVGYETTPMGTLIEADDAETVFTAAAAAHAAVDAKRVSTVIKIDDKRTTDAPMEAKVDRVTDALGRAPRG